MRELSYREALREAIASEMHRDPTVFLMGEDVGIYGGAFGVSRGLLEEFGEDRIRDTPVSEAGIIGLATGAALAGMRPIAEIMFMDFITIAMDQLVNQAAKIRFMFGGLATVPLVVRTAAGSGTGAAAQHSQSLEAWFVHVPGIKVVMPSTPYDAKGLLISAIRENNVVLFIEHKLLYNVRGTVPEDSYTIPLGSASVKRTGNDVTVIATSIMVPRALEAAEVLAKEGTDVEVIDPRTLKPLDTGVMIESIKKTGRALVIHEAPKTGGVGGEIVASLLEGGAFDYLDAPLRRLCGQDIPIPYNLRMERATVPQADDISGAVKALMA